MLDALSPLSYAGFWKRFNAYGIDATLVLILSLLAGWLVGDASAQPVGDPNLQMLNAAIANLQKGGSIDPALLGTAQDAILRSLTGGSLISFGNDYVFLVVSALYNIAFIAGDWQATPGKRWCRIKVVTENGARLGWAQSTFRHAMSGVSMLLGGAGYLTMFFTRERLALHDILCHTRVIHTHKEAAHVPLV